MRYHELALQRWLNRFITLRWGIPVPVVFTSPMDAFSLFSQLWSEANNPFQYLLEAKDDKGAPLYQPYPSPVRYPLISVHRKGWKFRNYQNFSIHRMRHINWPTVSSTGSELYGVPNDGVGLTQCRLGEVTTSRYPMAFDYRFQVDHFCNRPDTQAFFLSQLFRQFWRTGGPTLQTWIKVSYPGFGDKLVRMYIEGDIDSMTPEEPEAGKNVEFRTSFTLVIEGYEIDLNYEIYPALWTLILREGSAPPEALNAAFDFTGTVDLREQEHNPVVDYRREVSVMPPPGTCPASLRDQRIEAEQIHNIYFESLVVTYPGPLDTPGYIPAAGVEAWGGGTLTTLLPGTFSGTDYASLGIGFYYGSYALEGGSFVATGSLVDGINSAVAFHVGSMDLYIYTEGVPEYVTFLSGTHTPQVIDSGTQTDVNNFSVTFQTGTHTDAIVSVSGTETGTLSMSFGTGIYADVTVAAGTYFEAGTFAMTFRGGTHAAYIVEAGTRYEAGTNSISFYSGSYTLV